MAKFIVTIPMDIKANEPIEVEAPNGSLERNFALLRATLATVWTEAEWAEAQRLLKPSTVPPTEK